MSPSAKPKAARKEPGDSRRKELPPIETAGAPHLSDEVLDALADLLLDVALKRSQEGGNG